jgi:uncharacterized protein (TIGR03067 family)
MIGWLLMSLVAGLALGADAPKADEVAKDLKRFQGTWTLVSMEANGVKVEADNFKKAGITLIVEDEKITLKLARGDVKGTIKLDPTKKPKAYNATGTAPEGNPEESVGIYQLDEDTLTVCYVSAGKERPTEFKAGAGSEAVLQVFKRDKK